MKKSKFEVGEYVIFSNNYRPSIWISEPGIIEQTSYGFYYVYFFNVTDRSYQRPILEEKFLNKPFQLPFNFNDKS